MYQQPYQPQASDIGIGGMQQRQGYDPVSGGYLGSVDQWKQANAGQGYNVQDYGGGATGMGTMTPQQDQMAMQNWYAKNPQLAARMGQQQPQMSQPMRPPQQQQGGLLGGGMGGQNQLMQMLMQRMGGGMQQPQMPQRQFGGGQQMGGMGGGGFGGNNALLQLLLQRLGGAPQRME